MNHRVVRLLAGTACVLGTSTFGHRAAACGPCSAPEVWNVAVLSGRPVVLTNFGLLDQSETGWRLTCKEAIGGLLLDARGDRTRSVVSTDTGLFLASADLCSWHGAPISATNHWAVSLALPATMNTAPPLLTLRIDRRTQELRVERSDDGGDFVVLHSFGNTSGYRQIAAGGEPLAVFVSGYTYGPRAWNLAFSLDGGEHWSVVSPEGDATLTLSPGLVDPERPQALLVMARAEDGSGDELWRFDTTTLAFERLLELQTGELLAGLTLDDESIWVAGRRNGSGSLYRADREALVFSRATQSGPPFSCLTAHGDALYGCVELAPGALTRNAEPLVLRSTDAGERWEPWLTAHDLRRLESCGEACATSLSWLAGLFGASALDAGTADGAFDEQSGEMGAERSSRSAASGCSFGARRTSAPGSVHTAGTTDAFPVRALVAIGWPLALLTAAFGRRRRTLRSARCDDR